MSHSTPTEERSTGTTCFNCSLATMSRQSAAPPRYSTLGHVLNPSPQAIVDRTNIESGANAGSPGVGGGVLHFEHSFVIERAKPWATLYTFTQQPPPSALVEDPRKKPELPVVWGGSNLIGLVELHIDGVQTMQKIMVSLRGNVVSGYVDSKFKFMDYNILLWDTYMGNPRPLPQGSLEKFDGKFSGVYHFSFNIPWPTTIDLLEPSNLAEGEMSPFPALATSSSNNAVGKRQQTQSKEGDGGVSHSTSTLPQTFSEFSRVPGTVQYELVLTMIHGRFKTDSRINTEIIYIPSTVPPSPSTTQREAYNANQRPPGPLTDPDGWFALPQSTMKYKLKGIGGRCIEVVSTLHLANPTSYTRGTLIPCFLTLSSQDSNVLDILCSPKTPQVRLIRRIRHFTPYGSPVELRPTRECHTPLNVNLKQMAHEIGVATWRVPSQDVVQQSSVRHLEGEIHLTIDLEPTSMCPIFSIEYFVELLPVVSPIFDSVADKGASVNDTKKQVLASCMVEITTLHSPELSLPAALSKGKTTTFSSVTGLIDWLTDVY